MLGHRRPTPSEVLKMPNAKASKIKIRFVPPGDPVVKRKRRATPAEIGLRADMAQFYAMKSILEEVLGYPVYLKLKEAATIRDWREATIRLLNGVALAINSTVTIADQDWREEIADTITRGKKAVKGSDTISDLFATLSAVLTRIVFIQIGHIPSRLSRKKARPLTAKCWNLNSYRSVQYVQTASQRQALDSLRATRRAVGESHE